MATSRRRKPRPEKDKRRGKAPKPPAACFVQGCGKKPLAFAYCPGHYRRFRRHGTATPSHLPALLRGYSPPGT